MNATIPFVLAMHRLAGGTVLPPDGWTEAQRTIFAGLWELHWLTLYRSSADVRAQFGGTEVEFIDSMHAGIISTSTQVHRA